MNAAVPSHFRLLILLYWLRYGPGVLARVRRALAPAPTPAGSTEAIAALTALCNRVRQVARWVPRSRCLDQALAIWICAHELGLPANFRLGIRRVQGRTCAHAWISLGNQNIGEDPEALKHLLPLNDTNLATTAFD